MIKKPFEISNLDLNLNFFLFYGKNEGAKKEEVLKIISNNKDRSVSNYDEKQILDNSVNFYNEVLSKSLFDDKKIITINRASEKITKIVDELITKNLSDILIIICADIL
jgi:DNA polymerase III delta subunit